MDHVSSCRTAAQRLNADCHCVSLSRERLAAELDRVSPGFNREVMDGRPHLFADSAVFVGVGDLARMAAVVSAVEEVVALPQWREAVLAWAPASAAHRVATRGVFLGYDFHVGDGFGHNSGPQLIEINTNAGGGLLNAVLARAQQACCEQVEALLPGALGADTAEHLFLDMFRAEWRLARGDAPLRRIAIVDSEPERQYLYPEFVLFQRLFAKAGIEAVICDPAELSVVDTVLLHAGRPVDLVYNRLTDFSLDEPGHATLRAAWLADAAVVTPHPQAHALYADKRNLVLLSDDALLASWGVSAAARAALTAGVPRTEQVSPALAEDLWARRRQLFFKPAAGYGSKAAYRGDKITRRVFDEVLAGDYVAQALVPPSSRQLKIDAQAVELKLDLRNYVYAGAVQLVVARLWQGQTTNFRTPGGGFAPVLAVPATPEGSKA